MSNKYPGGFISLGAQVPSYSVVFDGSGDYLSVPDDTAFDLGAGDFTIEGWINTSSSAEQIFAAQWPGASNRAWVIALTPSSSTFLFAYTTNGTTQINTSATASLPVGTWTHIALCRSGTSLNFFANGVLVGTASIGSNTIYNSSTALLVGAFEAGSIPFSGYISNFRMVKGTAVYTSSFVVPTSPLKNITNTSLLTCQSPTLIDNSSNGFTVTAVGNAAVSSVQPPFQSYNPNNLDPALGASTPGVWTLSQALAAEVTRSWPMYDPYYKNVVLNLHGEGTNGAQNNTFVDSSASPLTITRNGNTTQGSFSPYGNGWSNNFGSANFFYSASNADFAFGTGDFTVEAWVNPTSAYGTYNYVFGVAVTGGLVFYVANGYLTLRAYNVSDILTSSTAPALNTWSHVAVVRSGTTVTIYINGVSVGSATSSYNFAQGAAYAGNDSTNAAPWYGYISNLRVVKGAAVYTSNFTPSTTPLTAISGTSWLVCQSNRFVDNSTSPKAITVSGSPTVQRFQPFLFNTSYTPSTIGGSGYFDGSDYLTVPYNASLELGSSDFTIDFWIYPTSSAAIQVPVSQWETSGNKRSYNVNISTTGILTLTTSSTGLGTSNTDASTAAGAIKFNAWNHVRISKIGTTAYLGANGVITTGSAVSTLYSPGTNPTLIGAYISTSPALPVTGYICDVRIVKGVALSTGSTYTVPTTPLTQISGTSLLCNFTNGAIYDNAMMNDLETVGNAQISTSVKKYGTGSLAFDGTGDYLYVSLPSNLALGSGDFTIEMWVYKNSGSSPIFIDFRPSSTNGAYPLIYLDASGYPAYYVSGAVKILATVAVTDGSWFHIAVCRSGTSTKLFVNGTQSGSTYSDSTVYLCPLLRPIIGCSGYAVNTANLNGYIDDLRITKGVARYVANFTPPTSQLQDQ